MDFFFFFLKERSYQIILEALHLLLKRKRKHFLWERLCIPAVRPRETQCGWSIDFTPIWALGLFVLCTHFLYASVYQSQVSGFTLRLCSIFPHSLHPCLHSSFQSLLHSLPHLFFHPFKLVLPYANFSFQCQELNPLLFHNVKKLKKQLLSWLELPWYEKDAFNFICRTNLKWLVISRVFNWSIHIIVISGKDRLLSQHWNRLDTLVLSLDLVTLLVW